MGVIVEGISVIVRNSTIEDLYPGGFEAYLRERPNQTLCFDDEIVRVGFMSPADVEHFDARLQNLGLSLTNEVGHFEDIAIVDQLQGPTAPCDWLQYGRLPINDNGDLVAACWLYEGRRFGQGVHVPNETAAIAVPPGWSYEKSLSARHSFVASEAFEERMEFLRTEDGVDVFHDSETGKEVFLPSKRGN